MQRLFVTVLFCVFVPFSVMAQNTLPAFTMPDEKSGQIRRAPPPASIEAIDSYQPFAKNSYLSDLIKLQYQIFIMEKLIERQTEIERVADAYASMQIAYSRPKPPYGICSQLPANALCMAYYPNLYSDAMRSAQSRIIEEVTELVNAIQVANEAADKLITDGKAFKKKNKSKTDKKQVTDNKTDYRWNDISCLAGLCQAVIQDAHQPNFRQTVSIGDVLPDQTVIASISAQGVRVKGSKTDDKAVALKPMPIGGAETIPTNDNPFGIPGLVNLEQDAPPVLFDLVPPPTPPSTEELEVQSTQQDGALVEAVIETEGEAVTEAPVLPATGLTF